MSTRETLQAAYLNTTVTQSAPTHDRSETGSSVIAHTEINAAFRASSHSLSG